MNLPQYIAAIESAVRECEETCAEAREHMFKAIASAKGSFFEDPESRKANYAEEATVMRR